MPNYADLLGVVQYEENKAILLSGSSIALLYTALGEWIEKSVWEGSADFGELTEEERYNVDGWIGKAQKELMTEVVMDTEPLGTMKMYIGASEPEKWQFCAGQYLEDVDYPDLYTAASSSFKYTIDGHNYVKVPDMRGNFPRGKSLTVALGGSGGGATHTLTVAEMPPHSHVQRTNTNADQVTNTGTTGANWRSAAAVQNSPSTTPNTTGSTGMGDAFSILPPYYVVDFIIKVLP